jgi:hypothetical protein
MCGWGTSDRGHHDNHLVETLKGESCVLSRDDPLGVLPNRLSNKLQKV